MKEAESKGESTIRLKYFIGTVVLTAFVTALASYYITAKTLVPALSTSIPTLTVVPPAQPSPTLYVLHLDTSSPKQTQQSEFEEPLRENMGFEIETNLLQNNSFENGLTAWTYTNDPEGVAIFETEGVNGAAFCSRRPVRPLLPDLLEREWGGFAQEIPLDPTQSYFFSAWIKLNEARNIDVHIKFYSGATEAAIGYLAAFGDSQPETSNGWFFIHNNVNPSGISRTPDRMVIEIVHDELDVNQNAQPTFSTVCIDDVFFGRIVK